jgi:hypothetical protein
LYPEIAGYYLTWIRFLHEVLGEEYAWTVRKADIAVQWLIHQFENERALLTRYWPAGNHDWRNGATFSFDLAMIYRGLCGMENLVSEELRKRALDLVMSDLLRFGAARETLTPFLTRNGDTIPDRWSTRPGGYQLKAAAALLFSAEPVPRGLESVAANTYKQWAYAPAESESFDNLHAALYCVEGLILFAVNGWDEAWGLAAEKYRSVIRVFRCTQSDVTAQALRAGCILHGRGILPGLVSEEMLPKLAEALVTFIGSDGDVFYHRPSQSAKKHRSVWGGLFAHQALMFYGEIRNGNVPPEAWAGMLV